MTETPFHKSGPVWPETEGKTLAEDALAGRRLALKRVGQSLLEETIMRESRPVVFLGAGASVPCKIPPMYDFAEEFRAHALKGLSKTSLKKRLLVSLPPLFRGARDLELLMEIFTELTSFISSPEIRVLKKLGFLEVKDFKSIREVAKELDQELRLFIRRRCSDIDEAKRNTVYSGFLGPLLKICQPPLMVFTTNYDTLVEDFARTQDLRFTDGFVYSEDLGLPAWNPGEFDSDSFQMKVFKLHGSISWYVDGKGQIVRIPVPTAGGTTSGAKLRELIVYPRSEKLVFTEPFAELYSRFRRTLRLPRRVIITVGYSFRDEHILNILKLGLRYVRARMWILDKRASVYRKQYFSEFRGKKVVAVDGSFDSGDTVERIMQDIRAHTQKAFR